MFSTPVATGLAAMTASFGKVEVRCNDSVHTPAGAPWNAFGSASDAGGGDAVESMIFVEGGHWHGSREWQEMSLTY